MCVLVGADSSAKQNLEYTPEAAVGEVQVLSRIQLIG